jgi:hypothetical protein
MDGFLEKHMNSGSIEKKELNRNYYRKYPEKKLAFEAHLRHKFGGAWKYNEIIGYIQLHFLGSQIRGEYWRIAGKRIVRTRHKTYSRCRDKLAPEIGIPYKSSNSEIYALVKDYLLACAKELEGRNIDSSQLESLGPYVDWQALLTAHKTR